MPNDFDADSQIITQSYDTNMIYQSAPESSQCRSFTKARFLKLQLNGIYRERRSQLQNISFTLFGIRSVV